VLRGQGDKSLTVLISRAWQRNQKGGRAIVEQAWLAELNEGLLLLSAGAHGPVGQLLLTDKVAQADTLALWFAEHFPQRFYLEVQRASRAGDETALHLTVAPAQRFQLPIVATNAVRFVDKQEFQTHEVRVCIHESYTLEDPR